MEEMLKMGIDVPEKLVELILCSVHALVNVNITHCARDAEWERSGQFIEGAESSKYCRDENCRCPLGRSHHSGIG